MPEFPEGRTLNEDREGRDERRTLGGRDYVKPNRRCNQPESKARDTGHYGTKKRGEKEENQVQRQNGMGHCDRPIDSDGIEGGWSAVALVGCVARPTVEGVKLRHRSGKLRQIIAIHARISEARSK